jgi:hypothetical protein
MSKQARKQDTRDKIMMGGLVIKAQLEYLHPANKEVLLGLLVDAQQKLQGEEAVQHFERFKQLGKKHFT